MRIPVLGMCNPRRVRIQDREIRAFRSPIAERRSKPVCSESCSQPTPSKDHIRHWRASVPTRKDDFRAVPYLTWHEAASTPGVPRELAALGWPSFEPQEWSRLPCPVHFGPFSLQHFVRPGGSEDQKFNTEPHELTGLDIGKLLNELGNFSIRNSREMTALLGLSGNPLADAVNGFSPLR
jgi:hypothetical protein